MCFHVLAFFLMAKGLAFSFERSRISITKRYFLISLVEISLCSEEEIDVKIYDDYSELLTTITDKLT